MASSSFRRKTAVLLFAGVLAFPLASAAGPRSERARTTESSVSVLLDLVGRALSFLTGASNKTGCQIDPDGRCAPGAPLSPPPMIEADSGCHIDPNGRCGA